MKPSRPADTAPPAASLAEIDQLLDASRYRLSEQTGATRGAADRVKRRVGFALGIVLAAAVMAMPLPAGLSEAGRSAISVFALAIVWWITEPVPTFVTSLVVMVLLVFLRAWDSQHVLGVLGMDVIWLNVMAFVLSSIMVKTPLGKRLALFFVVRFGKSAARTLLAFLILQLALAPLIPATAPRTILTLPLMMIVASAFGSPAGSPTNFGRNLFLQNLIGISICSSAFMTGSAANLMAVGFLQKTTGHRVYYTDWMLANLPLVLLAVAFTWVVGPRILFPLRGSSQSIEIPGGMAALGEYRRRMGRLSPAEIRGTLIFGAVVLLWVTDRFHKAWFGFEIDPVFAAIIGAVLALSPRIGVIKWSDADIPWQLMIFSCGAYASGLALEQTGAARWSIERLFEAFHLHRGIGFWPVYAVVVGLMMYSHLLFASKTMRTVIMIPFILTLAGQFGFPPAALALPAAFTIDWVVGLPISGKPNVILFGTGEYSVTENLLYGLAVCTFGYVVLLIAGPTWFRLLGITP